MCVCVCVCVCVLWLCICVLLAVARHLGMAISVISAAPLCKRMCDCVIVSFLLYAVACHRRHGAVCVRACARVCGSVSACATVLVFLRSLFTYAKQTHSFETRTHACARVRTCLRLYMCTCVCMFCYCLPLRLHFLIDFDHTPHATWL